MKLFICPLPPPIHGQSKISKDTVNLFKKKLVLDINYVNKSTPQKIGLFALYLVKLFYFFIRYDIKEVYLSISRSKFGALRDFPILLIGYLTDIKVIGHIHGGDFDTFIMSLTLGIRNKVINLYAACNTLIFPLKQVAEAAEKNLGINNAIVISNYLDETPYEFDDKIGNPIRILFMSNILRNKGINEYLNTIEVLKRQKIEIDARVAGSFMRGFEEVKKAVLKSEEEGLIKYLGFIEKENKIKELKECDFFILPSHSEAFGLVIIEAMASGSIIITSNKKYHKYLVDESFGKTFEFNNEIDAISNFIKELKDRPERMKEMKKAARRESKKFSFDNYKREITKLFDES